MRSTYIVLDLVASIVAAAASYGLYRFTGSAVWSFALLVAMTGGFVWWIRAKE